MNSDTLITLQALDPAVFSHFVRQDQRNPEFTLDRADEARHLMRTLGMA